MNEMSETALILAEAYLVHIEVQVLISPEERGELVGDLYKAIRKKVVEAYQE